MFSLRGFTLWSLALVLQHGNDAKIAELLEHDGINAEAINMCSVRPLDKATINISVRKTNHLVTVEEGFLNMALEKEHDVNLSGDYKAASRVMACCSGRGCPQPYL